MELQEKKCDFLQEKLCPKNRANPARGEGGENRRAADLTTEFSDAQGGFRRAEGARE
jgi:hypothetical protein